MKFISLFSCIVSLISLILLAGCCPSYRHWAEHLFTKANTVCMSVEDIHYQAVRKNQIRHDGLMTDEIARVMWRSDAVVEFHEHMAEECSGEREEQVVKRVEELKRENKDKAIFFVSLYGVKQDWSFILCKDGHIYKTAEVKSFDLDRIYKHIFGKAAFRYRQNIYQVTFDAAMEPPFEFKLCNGKYTASVMW
jgi:hypothetical protein